MKRESIAMPQASESGREKGGCGRARVRMKRKRMHDDYDQRRGRGEERRASGGRDGHGEKREYNKRAVRDRTDH